MSFLISNADKGTLDTAFEKMLRGTGIPANALQLSLYDNLEEMSTSGPVTFFIDPVTGNDLNDGGPLAPLATIGAALAKLPLIVAHTVTIKLAAGTYEEFFDRATIFAPGGTITVESDSWLPVTPATGLAAGTFDAAFGGVVIANTAVVTGAGWTVNDLKGKFVRLLTGPSIGEIFPIASNTADTIDVAFNATVDNSGGGGIPRDLRSQDFEIIEHGSIITPSPSMPATERSMICLSSLYCSSVVDTQTINVTGGFIIRNVKFDFGDKNYGINVGMGGNTVFNRCYMKSGGASNIPGANCTAIHVNGAGGGFIMRDCMFDAPANGNAFISSDYVGLGYMFNVQGTVFDGCATQLQFTEGSQLGIGGLFQNASDVAIRAIGGSMVPNGGTLVIRDCPAGIKTDMVTGSSCSVGVNGFGDFCWFINCGIGIDVSVAGLGSTQNVKSTIMFTNFLNCGDGIKLQAGHCDFVISNSSFTNTTNYAVNISGNIYAGHNFCGVDAATTFAGSGLGDFLIDGATPIASATLQADPDKTIVDLVYLNRLASNSKG